MGPPALTDLPLEAALRAYPWVARTPREKERKLKEVERAQAAGSAVSLRLVLDAPPGTSPDVRCDVPLCFEPLQRLYTIRCVRTEWLQLTPEMVMEVDECISQG